MAKAGSLDFNKAENKNEEVRKGDAALVGLAKQKDG